MNRQEKVLVIGNGFDLYHFLPTRYVDFLRTVNRLIELENNGRLSYCQYIKYLWGPDSPIYQQDEYIQKCYEVHAQKMRSVELNQDKLKELVAISKSNIWIKYFQACLQKDIGWIDFEEFTATSHINLKTIDILEHLPFAEDSEAVFCLKKEYCKKGIGGEFYVSIDQSAILEELEDDLEKLANALCIYLKEFVQKIAIAKSADNPVFYNIDKVLNFNYTDTYRRLYDADVEVKFIHGSINNEEKGIVLGINHDSKDELEEMDTGLIRFKKYYQRAIKDTFYSVEDFLNDEDVQYEVAIVGHSIEITDRDILEGLMNHPRTKVTIYYHNEKAHGQQVVNLISLLGKTRFDELRNQKKVVFSQLREFREAIYEEAVESEEEDFYEHKIKHPYRFLEESCDISNTLLIGNEIVHVSVRDSMVGIMEVKLVDHFLNLQEYYNHSGLYKGMVKLVSLFNDNRYCGAGASVEYIKAKDESSDNISEIKALFETECEGIGISVVDVNVVEDFA